MWFTRGSGGACPQLEAQLEEYLERLQENRALGADPEITAHLAVCRGCRRAIEEAQGASRLLSAARAPAPESLIADPFFASRVMARIRGYAGAPLAVAEFWPALETLALRLSAAALAVTVVLAGWASWQGRQARPAAQEIARARSTSAVEMRTVSARVLFPEMKRPPDNPGEAMMVLASTENGRQR
jgi:hypothetical protein